MTRTLVRTFGALAVILGISLPAAAQQVPSAILNSLEVQQLVARGDPADHERLAAHFAALADRYAHDATRHAAMAQAYAGNRSAGMAASMRAHCDRLAELATQSATALRELAEHHEALAAGKASAVPSGSARYEGGAAAPKPTVKDVKALAATASTPADHRALEEYFLTMAKRYTADANEHVNMAAAYRGTRVTWAAAHCDHLAALDRDAAKEATAAAAMHKELARIGR